MSTLWRLVAHADFAILADAVERLDAAASAPALSWSLFEDGDSARLDVLFETMPDIDTFREICGLTEAVPVEFGPMPEEDWVRLSLEGLKPVEAGRFTLFGAHDRDAVAAGQTGIEIEAGPAFGTGHHGTTRGCLMAFSDMLPIKSLSAGNLLDYGFCLKLMAVLYLPAGSFMDLGWMAKNRPLNRAQVECVAEAYSEGRSCFF